MPSPAWLPRAVSHVHFFVLQGWWWLEAPPEGAGLWDSRGKGLSRSLVSVDFFSLHSLQGIVSHVTCILQIDMWGLLCCFNYSFPISSVPFVCLTHLKTPSHLVCRMYWCSAVLSPLEATITPNKAKDGSPQQPSTSCQRPLLQYEMSKLNFTAIASVAF